MKSVLSRGLDNRQKEELKAEWGTSVLLRQQLVKALEGKIEENRKKQCDMDDFNCPNWQFKQAAYISKEKTLQELIDLLK